MEQDAQTVNRDNAATPQSPAGNRFVDPDEKALLTIGNDYFTSIVSGGGLSKLDMTLTNRRFYYRGSVYTGATLRKHKGQFCVELGDITATREQYEPVSIVTMAIIAIVTIAVAISFGQFSGSLAFVAVLIGALVALAYYLTRVHLYIVYFAGGAFGIPTRMIGEQKIRELDHEILRQKMLRRAEAAKQQ